MALETFYYKGLLPFGRRRNSAEALPGHAIASAEALARAFHGAQKKGVPEDALMSHHQIAAPERGRRSG
jgi:hypothetical protein